nr:hypothetical protein GCM10020092_097800 [Actinoplanes digitatis]
MAAATLPQSVSYQRSGGVRRRGPARGAGGAFGVVQDEQRDLTRAHIEEPVPGLDADVLLVLPLLDLVAQALDLGLLRGLIGLHLCDLRLLREVDANRVGVGECQGDQHDDQDGRPAGEGPGPGRDRALGGARRGRAPRGGGPAAGADAEPCCERRVSGGALSGCPPCRGCGSAGRSYDYPGVPRVRWAVATAPAR